MDALLEALAPIPQRPLGTVVYLGAGRLALDRLDSRAFDRLVLVEGDPEAASELRRAASDLKNVEVIERAVAAETGPIAWHRYNLRMLNGPVDGSRWTARFPRLRLLETRTLAAQTLAQLVGALRLPEAGDDRPRVLLIDLPGQEDALLAGCGDALRRRFDWILLRQELQPAGSSAARAVLADAGFVVVPGTVEADPVWPITLFRADAHAETVRLLAEARRRVQSLEEKLSASQARVAALQAEAEAAATRLREELGALRTQLDGQRKARTDAEAALAAARKQAAEGDAARAKLQEQLADRDARQRMLDGEILKAEAQLELIKDVLLREKNF